jgi:hypothetical protein
MNKKQNYIKQIPIRERELRKHALKFAFLA